MLCRSGSIARPVVYGFFIFKFWMFLCLVIVKVMNIKFALITIDIISVIENH
jgi:hypothetical protein